jgi:hypothetical protein
MITGFQPVHGDSNSPERTIKSSYAQFINRTSVEHICRRDRSSELC